MQTSKSTGSMNKLSDFMDFRPKKIFDSPNLQVLGDLSIPFLNDRIPIYLQTTPILRSLQWEM